ncbi:unnamed protein product [Urochloa decumbens]|uniref:protein disulfide-isomerase n=1 Tax=Urochloa decumbens TaxID=240449 RepID=A0ABC9BAN4_9POAL
MGNMVLHLENSTSVITSMHHLRDLWNSPRGTVVRIQALAVVAIVITFFLIAFGSCRRWSNRWIVQKGFFAAQVLSLSLGTYSIGIMQSSSVKSKMYPIWTVCLFTLFGCIDPVTTYNGLDYKGPLSKVVYGICLHCGYVLLMSISTISSVVGNTAIGVMSAITFIKGFHRSLALLQQSRMRNMVQTMHEGPEQTYVLQNNPNIHPIERSSMTVDFGNESNGSRGEVSLDLIEVVLKRNKYDWLQPCYDVCVAMFLSHRLQRRFIGLGYPVPDQLDLKKIDFNWAFKVIEIELALLYDVFFTGNPFLYYYQAKTASLWALASFVGICFVGVAVAIPGTLSSRHIASGPGGCINVEGTTTADLVITFLILVSLALLQLMQLIRCWTSNWARVAVACAYARNQVFGLEKETPCWLRRWMGLKAFVATSSNWFDKYLWQEKIGQYSLLPEGGLSAKREGEGSSRTENKLLSSLTSMVGHFYQKCARLIKVLGLDYIGEVLWDLLGSDTNKRTAVRLDDDVKGYITDFLHQIETDRVDMNWWSFLIEQEHPNPIVMEFLHVPFLDCGPTQHESHGHRYTKSVMKLHIATWYCELAEQGLAERIGCMEAAASYLKKAAAAMVGCFKKEAGGAEERQKDRNRCMANALSKYCAYLVVSAPELLPGPAPATKRTYDEFAKSARIALDKEKDKFIGALSDPKILTDLKYKWINQYLLPPYFLDGVDLAKQLLLGAADDPSLDVERRYDPWETLALLWVRMLVYAAPYGNVEAHRRHLQQGGEFITHLWALLYHLGIREWKKWKPQSHSTSTTKLPKDPQSIITVDDAERILSEDQLAVVAFLDSQSGSYKDELAAASKLEDGLSFYQTTSVDVAKLFHIDPAAKRPSLVLLKKEEFTLYHGPFRAYAIADFLSVNKKRRRGGKTDKDKTEEQIMEDGGQDEDEIEEDHGGRDSC